MKTVTKLCIQELEDYLLKKRIVTEWNTMARDISLRSLGLSIVASGMTRQVFKYPHSRSVFKIGEPIANRAEYVISQGLDGSNLGNLLAKSYGISKKGVVLSQEYVRKPISNSCAPSSFDWVSIREGLEALLNFDYLGNVRDMHPGNIHLAADGHLKIIDYAHGLKPTVTKDNTEKLIRKIRKISKLIDRNVEFYLTATKEVVLFNGAVSIKMPLSKLHQEHFIKKIL